MHHFFEAITNTAGDSLIGYFARVIDRTTQNTVTLSSDDNGTPIVTVSGVENMAKSDAYGNLSLYVVPGTYHLDIYAPNTTSFLYRVSDVAMNSTKGDPGPQGDQGLAGEGLAEVMAPDGAGKVGFRQPPATAVDRNQLSKSREVVSIKDFGALGNFTQVAGESEAVEKALAAVRNPNDASFTGAVHVPADAYRLTKQIVLPSSFVRLHGDTGSTIWGAAGQHVLRANNEAFVQSKISGFRIFGGVDAIRADTPGEIATIEIDNLLISSNTGNAMYFQSALTSSKIRSVQTGGGTKGLWCTSGLNNNNVARDVDFNNHSDDVVRVEGRIAAFLFDNIHIEGGGVAGKSQYYFENPWGVSIKHGWYEGGHENLLTIVNAVEPMTAGVVFDGITSIGSSDFVGGFTGSKFNVGNVRVIFGSNYWLQPTTAPLNVFVYGVNDRLRVADSNVWSRDTTVDKRVTGRRRTVVDVGTRTFPLFTATRASNASTPPFNNQQALTVRFTVQFTGLDSGGNPKGAVWTGTAFIQALGAITDVQLSTLTVTGPVGDITLTIQQGAKTALSSTVNAVIQGLNTDFKNYVNYSLEVLNLSGVEADGFVVSV